MLIDALIHEFKPQPGHLPGSFRKEATEPGSLNLPALCELQIKMVLETWFNRLGNSVSSTFKTAIRKASFDPWKNKNRLKSDKVLIGVLAFEVANLMSKLIQLWHSLCEEEIVRIRTEVITLEGVRRVVSSDDGFLLGLACAEKLDNLTVLAGAVARLGKKCQDPALQGFEHVYEDLLCNNIDFKGLVFSPKEIDSKIKKMEKYASATTNLYREMEVLADLEQTLRRMQSGDDGTRLKDGSLLSVQQKVSWQRQETKYLREISLWNRSFDAIVGLLAQTAFTIYGRIRSVFGVPQLDSFAVNQLSTNLDSFPRSRSVSALASGPYSTEKKEVRFCSGPLERVPMEMNPGRRLGPVLNRLGSNRVWQDRDRHTIVGSVKSFVSENKGLMTWGSSSPARPSQQFVTNGTDQLTSQNSSNVESTVGCMTTSVSGNADKSDYQTPMAVNGFHSASTSGNAFLPHSGQMKTSPFNGTKCKLLNAPPSTLGGAALALHYANVIIVIEKLVQYPHLIGPDARDDLYQMLPTSLRTALRARLKSYAKNMASTKYNGALAANWNDALGRILEWLAPLAHNMIRWQTERNFEQQHLVPRTNVLLLQTLYFANQVKTELAITELLVGLNYICRYEQEIRSNGHMECANSHDYDEYLEWQL